MSETRDGQRYYDTSHPSHEREVLCCPECKKESIGGYVLCEECYEQMLSKIEQLRDFIGLWEGHDLECDYLDEGSPRTDCTCGYEAARVKVLKETK